MTLFRPLVLTRFLYTTAAVVTDYWSTQHAFLNEEAQGLLQCSYLVATACQLQHARPMDEKSLPDCAELAGMHRSLRAVSDIMVSPYSVACFSQNCSGLLKLSRWHLQTLRPIVSSPDRCGFNTNSSLFSLNRLSIWTVFGSGISLRRDSALYNWVYWQCLSIVPALSDTIKSLF